VKIFSVVWAWADADPATIAAAAATASAVLRVMDMGRFLLFVRSWTVG
jgi:hypothetical protein